MKDYISEISSPSISPDNLSGIEVQSYLRLLESARQSFIEIVAQYPNNVVKAYLNELMEAKKVIIKRGFIGNEQPALEMVQADIKEAELIYIFSILDKGMMQSLEKTASFLQQVIGEEQPTEPQPQPIIEQPQPEEKDEKQNVVEGVKVISGTQGLADYLGCSKSMAFGIISRGVLKDIGIQYMVGKCWKFNREKLDKYLKEHPDLLANVRCKR